jgi:hypothetical protein
MVRGVSVSVRALWMQERSGTLRVFEGMIPKEQTVSERWLAKESKVVIPSSVE